MAQSKDGQTLAQRSEANQWMTDFEEWQVVKREAAKATARERELRAKLFAGAFPDPVEGSKNQHELPDGRVVKANYKINRTVDVAALTSLTEHLREKGIPLDRLVKYKPELSKSEYNKLSDTDRKLFDSCLTIKPGSVEMSIV